MTPTQQLIYRATNLEHLLNVKGRMLIVYDELIKFSQEELLTLKDSLVNKRYLLELELELMETKQKYSNLAVEHKNMSVEYKEYVMPAIGKLIASNQLTQEDAALLRSKINIDSDIAKQVEENTKYKAIDILPENTEQLSILENLRLNIDLLKGVIVLMQEDFEKQKADGDKSSVLTLVKLLESKEKLNTLFLRYNQRKDYYENHFLPKHNATVEQCNKYFDTYIEAAKFFTKHDIDHTIGMVVIEYEKQPYDDELKYQTFVALKERLKRTAKHIRQNKSKYKNTGALKFAAKELYE